MKFIVKFSFKNLSFRFTKLNSPQDQVDIYQLSRHFERSAVRSGHQTSSNSRLLFLQIKRQHLFRILNPTAVIISLKDIWRWKSTNNSSILIKFSQIGLPAICRFVSGLQQPLKKQLAKWNVIMEWKMNIRLSRVGVDGSHFSLWVICQTIKQFISCLDNTTYLFIIKMFIL